MEDRLGPDEVREDLKRIESAASCADDEQAHIEEDLLHVKILRAISENRCDDPAECCRLALTAQEIDFARWCA